MTDTSEHISGRLEVIHPDRMSTAQLAVYQEITAGPRGQLHGKNIGLSGPFNAWIRNAEMANHAQRLGATLRFNTSLPTRLSELAIITVGKHMAAAFEFAAHAPIAIQGGLAAEIVEAIRVGAPPNYHDEDEELVHKVARALLEQHGVDDELYRRTCQLLGEVAMVELVALVGYYSLVSLTLNTFRVPLREGMTDPFGAK